MEENMKYLVEEERTQTKRVYFSKGREDWRRFYENNRSWWLPRSPRNTNQVDIFFSWKNILEWMTQTNFNNYELCFKCLLFQLMTEHYKVEFIYRNIFLITPKIWSIVFKDTNVMWFTMYWTHTIKCHTWASHCPWKSLCPSLPVCTFVVWVVMCDDAYHVISRDYHGGLCVLVAYRFWRKWGKWLNTDNKASCSVRVRVHNRKKPSYWNASLNSL
jgi:hypothetical protein